MDLIFKVLQKVPKILKRKHLKQLNRHQSKQRKKSTIACIRSSSEDTHNRSSNQIALKNKTPKICEISMNLTNAKSKYRYWQPPDVNANNSYQASPPFKVVSYNILAQDLLLEHLQLYRLCDSSHLKWKYRLSRLTDEINAQRPDILCLQEVQMNHLGDIFANIKERVPLGCIFKKKTGFRTDGCAIFYNKDLFDVVATHTVEYYQPGFELLDRHNIGLVARLCYKLKPDRCFLICTTHLLYNPRRQDVRLGQIIVLLAELDRYSVMKVSKGGDVQRIPIILTGDFNFESNSAPFDLITTGKLHYEGLSRNTLTESGATPTGKQFISPRLGITDNCQHIDCVKTNYKQSTSRLVADNQKSPTKPATEECSELFSTGTLTHGLSLRSVYNHSTPIGSTHQNGWIKVDHIFYTEGKKSKPQGLNLLSVYQLPSVYQCYQIGQLPNAELGSDHLMLAALFSLSTTQ